MTKSSNLPKFNSFDEFYPFYLTEHTKPTTKFLHFVGTTLGLLVWATKFLPTFELKWIFVGMFCGYFCAWVSHFFVEKNKPASFNWPLWSFRGDWVMWLEILQGKHDVMPSLRDIEKC